MRRALKEFISIRAATTSHHPDGTGLTRKIKTSLSCHRTNDKYICNMYITHTHYQKTDIKTHTQSHHVIFT